MADIVSGIIR